MKQVAKAVGIKLKPLTAGNDDFTIRQMLGPNAKIFVSKLLRPIARCHKTVQAVAAGCKGPWSNNSFPIPLYNRVTGGISSGRIFSRKSSPFMALFGV